MKKITLLLLLATFCVIANCCAVAYGMSVEDIAKTVVFLTNQQAYETVQGKQVQVWYKQDPSKEQYTPKIQPRGGTGFIISHDGEFYLITAKHVADFLSDEAELHMNTAKKGKIVMSFGVLKTCPRIPGAKWFFDENADLAIHPLCLPPEQMDVISIPDGYILKYDKPIPLLSAVYVIGFPLGLGTAAPLKPVATKLETASDLIPIPAINPSMNFLLLDHALAQGYSGAPIFLLFNDNFYLVGVVSAQLPDNLGGKMSVAVPSLYIWNILQSQSFASYKQGLIKK